MGAGAEQAGTHVRRVETVNKSTKVVVVDLLFYD